MGLFWLLLVAVLVFSVLRFPLLRRHLGTGQAILVLLLRLVALAVAALLVSPVSLAFHRPVTQPLRLAVLVDASASTATPERTKAIERLRSLLEPHGTSVLLWQFDETLKPTDWRSLATEPKGKASRLSTAVQSVVTAAQPDFLLLLTDGQDTDPLPDEKVVSLIRRSGTVLHTVVLPHALPPNLSLSVSPTRQFLFAGEEGSVLVQVQGHHLPANAFATVSLWEGQRQVAQTRVRLQGGKTQVTFPVRPTKSGWQRYRVTVTPSEGESWLLDNTAEVAVWQSPTKLRVLLVTGAPNFDFKFVKQALESEPNFEWAAIANLPDGTRFQQGVPSLLPVSLQRLAPFHVLLLIAPSFVDFGSAEGQAVATFVRSGGGLLLTIGERTVRTQGWLRFLPMPLPLLPLPPSTPLTANQNDALGRMLPPLPVAEAAWAIKAERLSAQAALSSQGQPVLVWWQEGLGKIAVLAIEGTWRWVMDAAQKGETTSTHRQFWRTLVRFLADPTKRAKETEIARAPTLIVPQPAPPEIVAAPQPKRVRQWAEESGGQVLSLEQLDDWFSNLQWSRVELVQTTQPLSALPLPYLLLLFALTVEWWLVRRSGLP